VADVDPQFYVADGNQAGLIGDRNPEYRAAVARAERRALEGERPRSFDEEYVYVPKVDKYVRRNPKGTR
jgi:hypothetical protein